MNESAKSRAITAIELERVAKVSYLAGWMGGARVGEDGASLDRAGEIERAYRAYAVFEQELRKAVLER
jgi:hypothetical protein